MRCGIIPIMIQPESKDIYVLLGRNRTSEAYAGSHAWSDFGGIKLLHEKPEACAARELAEESLETLVKFHECHIMQQALEDGEYIYKRSDHESIIWFVRFKWNPAALFEFASIHKILSTMSKICKKYQLTNSEKNVLKKYRWFCKDTRLNDILEHPAIIYEKKHIYSDSIIKAQSGFATLLNIQYASKDTLAYMTSTKSYAKIVKNIKPEWLEKDLLQLFSIPQLCAMICQGSATCSKGICSQLDLKIISIITQFIRLIRFRGCIE
jgi:hypothetical protein